MDWEGQPYRGDQLVIIEKRDAQGKLDFSPPQPPVKPLKFDAVYSMYFKEVPHGDSAGWPELLAWLRAKSWIIRPCTWE